MRRIRIPSRFERIKLQRFIAPLLIILLVAVAATAGAYANQYAKTAAEQRAKYKSSQTELKRVNNQLEEIKQEKLEDSDSSKQQIQKLEEEKKSLEQQLQAKAEQKARLAAAAVVQAIEPVAYAEPITSEPVSTCGDNFYANYIYSHESSCNLTVTNAEGCIGIGQACPASKLTAVCPNLDYACENAFFTAYANKYGGWAGAYQFWLANHWW